MKASTLYRSPVALAVAFALSAAAYPVLAQTAEAPATQTTDRRRPARRIAV